MPTLEEILSKDLGLGSSEATEKVAAESTPESDDIEKLAMEIGLAGTSEDDAASQETNGHNKEAKMNMESLYEQAFPEDADIVAGSQEKVAAETKEAADIEEAMGEVAFDHFSGYVDGHITKLAQAAAEVLEKEGSNEEPPETMDNNNPDSEAGIDTTPEVMDSVKDTSPEGGVGKYEQKKGPMGELKTAAFRKAYLTSLIEK